MLKRDYEFMLNFYQQSFRSLYYTLMASYYKNKGILEGEEAYEFLAKNIETIDYEFYEQISPYKEILKQTGECDNPISEAKAFYIVSNIYKKEFNNLENHINKDNLTKMEQYMVHNFYMKLKSPLRNPNVQIKDGESSCYYDKYNKSNEFNNDMKLN